MEKILAERDKERREFPPRIWELLPSHRYGWQVVVREIPPVVLQNMGRPMPVADLPRGEQKAEVFKEKPKTRPKKVAKNRI